MATEPAKRVRMLTVIASSILFRPDGRAAIQLVTRQAGTIAFEVNQGAINALRRHLARAEEFLRQPKTRN